MYYENISSHEIFNKQYQSDDSHSLSYDQEKNNCTRQRLCHCHIESSHI